jgi:hypothetical protein
VKECTVIVESTPDALRGDENTVADRLGRVDHALPGDERALGAAVMLHKPTGVLSALSGRRRPARPCADDRYTEVCRHSFGGGMDAGWNVVEGDDDPDEA